MTLAVGCVPDGFVCNSDDACVQDGVMGVCEKTGYCGFPDDSCPVSRRRYGDASASYGGACVETGTIYYVALSGRDDAPGTEARPFRTINHGASVLSAGDALFVGPGTYDEAISEIPAGESWSYPVTIASRPPRKAVLRAGAEKRSLELGLFGDDPSPRYVIIEGLVIDGSGGLSPAVGIHQDAVRIRDCEVMNAPETGVLVSGAHNELLGLDVHDNYTLPLAMNGGTGGIALFGSDNLVDGCRIHDNNGVAVIVYNVGLKGGREIIRKNTIYNAGPEGARGIYVYAGEGTIAYDNVVYDIAGECIVVNDCNDARVFNNTTYSGSVGITIGEGASGAIVQNNVAAGVGGTPGLISDRATGTQLSNNVVENPLFVDPARFDFRLRAGSPAIDKGVTIPDVPDDFDGVKRPRGSAYDVGAFER